MTRKELTGIRDLTFSQWIRSNLPCSSTGFMVTDLDFILSNYKTKKIMLIEVKTRNADIKTWQKHIFTNLHKWIHNGISKDWTYLGFHLIQFENQDMASNCFFDREPVSLKELKNKLSF